MNSNNSGTFNASILAKLYGKNEVEFQKKRYEKLVSLFNKNFMSSPELFFSSPGRTEIGGNHTDHNHGRVIAASINLDAICAVSKTDDMKVSLSSDAFKEQFVVDLNDLSVVQSEIGTTSSLIRGIAKGFDDRGLSFGGFNAYITSNVLVGSGLSSSASVEVLIGKILSYLFNQNKVDAETIAIIGQFAENNFFGKPCGLMDQMACATGGIITIDFENPAKPQHEKLKVDFGKSGYGLLIIDTGGSHADLTDDYASVPAEMKSVAKFLGKNVCREVSKEDLLKNVVKIRKKVGDRAFLRAYHFVFENERVVNQVSALKKNNFAEFLKLVNESGNSSFKWLQNIYSTKNVHEQSVSIALALVEKLVQKYGGASRIHGGGFAGTIQVFVPKNKIENFADSIAPYFAKDAIKKLSIRNYGVICLDELN
ncbi:MAG: galactokinase [Stygiobacter sp. RIFOXYC12_FULL_38_8]|nr:MAG: galactokinase [Stygiobacter sp. GWC2_38_9]OGU81599.1 MAG: galactokinase [Stygiobacter sp. RIFOXYA12_FULL_38_9]OGV09397.1 MAG: galactokinase [Stygiobacter sp. RIFOXYB2_FULL_37_11]OGV15177.1 MAG: galactokinase [Stygiobacter sp. RIFOXYC2_FULL_38_25]OGV17110.1 MAG: galactokinase [Stygiobacter sp. RIFOXYA2_FULL_38_8]OGV24556.1 MAG: galactokinase [Stygiobacter sp. RIFOXYC12_FULL_38_8]OGV79761.1 MAG: galactokinase [Stygiobacter sp. GWF2_38_21]